VVKLFYVTNAHAGAQGGELNEGREAE